MSIKPIDMMHFRFGKKPGKKCGDCPNLFEAYYGDRKVRKCKAYGGLHRLSDQSIKPGEKMAATRKSILEQAMKCISGERIQDYGAPEHSLTTIGRLWAGYINGKFGTNIDISGADASAMMVLFKMARVATGHNKEDNWVDAAGYAACGGELEGRNKSED